MGASILAIEDHPDNLELMTYLLRAFGHAVYTAENGLGGIEAAGRHRPELILCDIELPDIDGIEVARRLRADRELRSIPFIMLTSTMQYEDGPARVGKGADRFPRRPIEPGVLSAEIRECLRDGGSVERWLQF